MTHRIVYAFRPPRSPGGRSPGWDWLHSEPHPGSDGPILLRANQLIEAGPGLLEVWQVGRTLLDQPIALAALRRRPNGTLSRGRPIRGDSTLRPRWSWWSVSPTEEDITAEVVSCQLPRGREGTRPLRQ